MNVKNPTPSKDPSVARLLPMNAMIFQILRIAFRFDHKERRSIIRVLNLLEGSTLVVKDIHGLFISGVAKEEFVKR